MRTLYVSWYVEAMTTKQVFKSAVLEDTENGSRLEFFDTDYGLSKTTSDKTIAHDTLSWAAAISGHHAGAVEYSGIPAVKIESVHNFQKLQIIESAKFENAAWQQLQPVVKSAIGLNEDVYR